MEVIHQNEKITHAVLGRGESIEFKASTSSQIIFLLSTGLYKYPRLATVREIICNGWDAHIVSGIRDVPVKITIDRDGILSIRDFGTGIPHDMIGPIYCTAGDSTKKESEDETGGFGLGSKAPFAYADHFKVTSHCNGIKTIYAMALSDSTKQGEPSAKVLFQGPTTETGIEVSLELKEGDIMAFEKLIQRVCFYGDINATLNGQQLTVCGMDAACADTSFVADEYSGDLMNGHNMFVRYGAVIYPLEHNSEYHTELRALQRVIRDSFGDLNGGHLIVRAPANSVSMVPSREALLYSPRTIETVKELLIEALGTLHEAAKADHKETIRKIIRHMAMGRVDTKQLLEWDYQSWPTVYNDEGTKFCAHDLSDNDGSTSAHTIEQMAMYYAIHNPSHVLKGRHMRKWYRELLWDLVNNLGDDVNWAFAKKLMSPNRKIPHGTLIREYVTGPLRRAADRAGFKDIHKNLFLKENSYGMYMGQLQKRNGKWIQNTNEESVFDAVPHKMELMIWMLKPRVTVMGYQKIDRNDALQSVFRTTNDRASFFIPMPKTATAEDARRLCVELARIGFNVSNTFGWQMEQSEYRSELARQRRLERLASLPKDMTGKPIGVKKKKEQLPVLSYCLQGSEVRRNYFTSHKAPLIEDPKIILVQRVNQKVSNNIGNWTSEMSVKIIKKYGDAVGVTNREDVAERFFKNGAKPLEEVIWEEAKAELASNPKYVEYAKDNALLGQHTLSHDWQLQNLLNNFCENQQFREKMGLITLTKEEAEWYCQFAEMHDYIWRYHRNGKQNKADFDFIEKAHKEVTKDMVHPLLHRFRAAKDTGHKLAQNLNSSSFYQLDRRNAEASRALVDFIFVAFNL